MRHHDRVTDAASSGLREGQASESWWIGLADWVLKDGNYTDSRWSSATPAR